MENDGNLLLAEKKNNTEIENVLKMPMNFAAGLFI